MFRTVAPKIQHKRITLVFIWEGEHPRTDLEGLSDDEIDQLLGLLEEELHSREMLAMTTQPSLTQENEIVE